MIRFSLRNFLVAIVIMSVPIVYTSIKWHQSRAESLAIKRLEEISQLEFFLYDYQLPGEGRTDIYASPPGPEFLRRILGKHFFARVKFLHIRTLSQENLQILKRFPRLQFLDITNCSGLTSLSELRGADNLKGLELGACPSLKSIGVIDKWKLRDLTIKHCDSLTSIEGLQGLSQLQRLEITIPENCELDGIGTLNKLESLALNCFGTIENFELAKLAAPQISILDLRGDSIVDLNGINEFHNLEKLYLKQCQLQSLCPAKSLPKLKFLHLSDCPLLTGSDLVGFSGLRKLSLWYCLDELDYIASLKDLEAISFFAFNHPISFDWVLEMKNLKEINFSSCHRVKAREDEIRKLFKRRLPSAKVSL